MIEDLEREGHIKKLPVDRKKVDGAMALAHRDALLPKLMSGEIEVS